MTLISWNGTGPILKSGAIGTEQACCCNVTPPPSVGNCCGSIPRTAVTVARSLSVTLTLGTKIATISPTICTQAQAEALINGTYILPYLDSLAGTAARYSLTTAAGVLVTVGWYCRELGGVSMVLELGYCDIPAGCYDRASLTFSFDAPGFSAYGSSAPTLCSITQGNTDEITGLTNNPGNDYLVMDQGILSCSSNAGYNFDRYDVTISIVPSW